MLYFSILKSPVRSPLLPGALEGISHYAHLINIDFFRDLLAVLRQIVSDQVIDNASSDTLFHADLDDSVGASRRVRLRLQAIVTAFDLLSGQGKTPPSEFNTSKLIRVGEALNIDLGDFINALFALLRPLSLDTGLEDPPSIPSSDHRFPLQRSLKPGRAPPKIAVQLVPTSTLLFRCLHSIFFSRNASSASAPSWRAAAFSKRLVECSLVFPPETAKKSLEVVRALMVKEPKLEAMLDTEERTFDGVYRSEVDDPQLMNPFSSSLWELEVLATKHWDRSIRGEALKLREGNLVK